MSFNDSIKSDSVELNLNGSPAKYFKETFKIASHSSELDQISFKDRFKQYFKARRTKVSKPGYLKRFFLKKIPIVEWLPKYDIKKNIFPDLVSGNTVGIMNIPQGMAYSLLATLPPINGLYMSVFPILIYTIFGTSRHLTTGAVAIISLLTGSAIDKAILISNVSALYHNRTDKTFDEFVADYRLSLACCLAFLVGLIQLLMGLFGVGKILISYFSDTFISGYTCASAFHVLTSQVKELLGLRNLKKYDGAFKIPKSWINIISKLNTLNLATVILSAFSIIFLVIFKEFANRMIKDKLKFEFPSDLVLVILLTFFSYVFDFNQNFNISIVKTIPKGLPTPKLPDLRLSHLMFMDAVLIACIAFSISLSLATLFSRKNNYKINPTQELYAFSATNMFGSCFSCFPNAGSLSRSSTLNTMGGKTQLASFFSSFFSFMVILWMGPLLESLTKNCLAAIIVVALKSLLLQFKDLFSLWKINKLESVTWIVTFLSALILNIDYGLFIGIGFSILMIVIRDQSVPIKNLMQYKNTSNYIDPNVVKIEGNSQSSLNVRIIKMESSLYFANCDIFQTKLYESHSPIKPIAQCVQLPESENNLLSLIVKEPDLVFDFSAVNYVDTNGAKIVKQIIEDYKSNGVFVYICNAQESFLKILFNMELLDSFEPHLFVSVDDALISIKEKLN